MIPFRHPEPIDLPSRVPPHEPRPGIEDRDWRASSRDLARGLEVSELLETPADGEPEL